MPSIGPIQFNLTRDSSLQDEVSAMSHPAKAVTVFLGVAAKLIPGLKSDKVLDYLSVKWSPHDTAVEKRTRQQATKTIHNQQSYLAKEQKIYKEVILEMIRPLGVEATCLVDTGILTEGDEDDGFFSVLDELVLTGAQVVKLKDELKKQSVDEGLDLSENVDRKLIEKYPKVEERKKCAAQIHEARYKVLSEVLEKPIVLFPFSRGTGHGLGTRVDIRYKDSMDGALRIGVPNYPKVNMNDDTYAST